MLDGMSAYSRSVAKRIFIVIAFCWCVGLAGFGVKLAGDSWDGLLGITMNECIALSRKTPDHAECMGRWSVLQSSKAANVRENALGGLIFGLISSAAVFVLGRWIFKDPTKPQ